MLDTVLGRAGQFRRGLAQNDRRKFDEYLNAVSEVEKQVLRSDAWLDRPKPALSAVRSAPEYPDLEREGGRRIAQMRAMYDLAALALQTDSTRVISLKIPGGNASFPIEGVNDGYHSLTHHGKDPAKIAQLKKIEVYYTQELARFLNRLKSIREGDGTLLDHTIVLFGSGMGNASSHSNRNLPTLVAGGGFQHGRSLKFERPRNGHNPLCKLFVSLLQQLKIETDSFGPAKGTLTGLGA